MQRLVLLILKIKILKETKFIFKFSSSLINIFVSYVPLLIQWAF